MLIISKILIPYSFILIEKLFLTSILDHLQQIVRVLNASPVGSITIPFQDVKETAWCRDELDVTIVNGIAKEFNSNEFRPNAVVNRVQAAELLVNVLVKECVTPPPTAQHFSDDSDIAFQYGHWMTEIRKGYPGISFYHKNGLTRAASVVMTYCLRDHLNSFQSESNKHHKQMTD